jgi:hypothetical protein
LAHEGADSRANETKTQACHGHGLGSVKAQPLVPPTIAPSHVTQGSSHDTAGEETDGRALSSGVSRPASLDPDYGGAWNGNLVPPLQTQPHRLVVLLQQVADHMFVPVPAFRREPHPLTDKGLFCALGEEWAGTTDDQRQGHNHVHISRGERGHAAGE